VHSDTSDTGEGIEPADGTGPGARPWTRSWFWLVVLAVVGVAISVVFDTGLVATWLALLLGFAIVRTGLFFLQSFATPPPPPPDPGTLRKVKLVYRCNVCGAEVRMTAATTEDPEPPRHCMDDMQLVSPID
jgi:hypothetical protein